jgi:hypothetical protein
MSIVDPRRRGSWSVCRCGKYVCEMCVCCVLVYVCCVLQHAFVNLCVGDGFARPCGLVV